MSKKKNLKLTVFVNMQEKVVFYPDTVEHAFYMKESMAYLLLTFPDSEIDTTSIFLEVYNEEEELWEDWFDDKEHYEFNEIQDYRNLTDITKKYF